MSQSQPQAAWVRTWTHLRGAAPTRLQTSQGAGKGCPWLPYYYREADVDYTPPRRDVGGWDEGVCSRTGTQVVPSGG